MQSYIYAHLTMGAIKYVLYNFKSRPQWMKKKAFIKNDLHTDSLIHLHVLSVLFYQLH